MTWLRVIGARIAGVLRKAKFEREIDEELRFHLQMRVQEKIARGLSCAAARVEATREFGNVALIKDEVRDVGGGGGLETFLHDLRFGARSLAKEKSFTIAAVLALVLGIGANTALFTVLSSVLLRPLPFAEPDQLFAISMQAENRPNERLPLSYPDFADFRARNQHFESLGGYAPVSTIVARAGHAGFQAEGACITPEILRALRVHPALGRGFVDADNERGARAVIVSDRFWREEFGQAPEVIGSPFYVDGEELTVVGVMPPGFRFPVTNRAPDYWITFARSWDPYTPGTMSQNEHRDSHWVSAIGRLRNGTTIAEARKGLNEIARALAAEHPNTNRILNTAAVVPLLDDLTREARMPLLMLIGAAVCVLCVACANVANLLLARGTTRQKEISLRSALGAGRTRIVRQLLTESLLLATIAATAGTVVALIGTRFIVALLPPDFPRAHEIVPDARVLAFTALLALATTALFGFVPALRAVRSPLAQILNECSRASNDTTRGRRLRSLFVIAQMTLSFVLVSGACFLLRGFWQLQHANPGFDSENLNTVNVSIPNQYGAETVLRNARIFAELNERAAKIGGVQSASAIWPLPFTYRTIAADFEIIGRPPIPKIEWPRARAQTVTLNYFATMKIPLLRGRVFEARDDRDSPPVAIINETLARTVFPNEDPIGKIIRPGLADSGVQIEREIVGIVGDVKSVGLSAPQRAEIYLPHQQCAVNDMTLVIRSRNPLQQLLDDVRFVAQSVDKTLIAYNPRMMDEYIDDVVAQPRLTSVLLSTFAVVALVLSAIGVYGTMAYSVAQRRHELCIRLAFGATRPAIFQLLFGEGARVVTWSLVLGGAASALISPLLKKLVVPNAGNDFLIMSGVAVLLVGVAMLASWFPVRRAATEDPLRAIGQR